MLMLIKRFLHLVRVGGRGISHLQNDSGNVHHILLSINRYFKEELKQSVWGGGGVGDGVRNVVRPDQIGSCKE